MDDGETAMDARRPNRGGALGLGDRVVVVAVVPNGVTMLPGLLLVASEDLDRLLGASEPGSGDGSAATPAACASDSSRDDDDDDDDDRPSPALMTMHD